MAVNKTVAGTWAADLYYKDADGRRRRLQRTFDNYRDAVVFQDESRSLVRKNEFMPLNQDARHATIEAPLKKLFGPCVYVVKEAGTDSVLYIGMSTRGVSRIVAKGHRVIRELEANDSVIVKVIFADDADSAARLESSLIIKHRPRFNSIVNLKPFRRRSLSESVANINP